MFLKQIVFDTNHNICDFVLSSDCCISYVGVAYKVWLYKQNIPAPLKIPTTPAPTTRTVRVAFRMVKGANYLSKVSLSPINGRGCSVGFFILACSWFYLRHIRYFTDPVWGWVAFLQPFGKYAAFMMLALD